MEFIKEKEIVDESYRIEDTGKYKLAIEVSLNDFEFVINDTERNKFVCFEKYKLRKVHHAIQLCEALDEVYKTNQKLGGEFDSVKVLYVNKKATLIPVPLYEEEEKEVCFSFNHTLEPTENILCDKLKNINAYNLFSISKILKEKFDELFVEHKLIHYSTSLIENTYLLNLNKDDGFQMYINFKLNMFDLIIMKGNSLVLYNAYKISSAEDFIYHILFAMQNLSLSAENVKLNLMGEIDKTGDYYKILYKYIQDIDFIEKNKAYQYSYGLDELAGHYYYNLFNAFYIE